MMERGIEHAWHSHVKVQDRVLDFDKFLKMAAEKIDHRINLISLAY